MGVSNWMWGGAEDTGDPGVEDGGAPGTPDTGPDTGQDTDCDPDCINGGACTASGTCDCTDTGYSGDRCEIPVCDSDCENGGTCTEPNSCDCPPEFAGSLCDECAPHLSNYPDCDQCAPNVLNYPACDRCEPHFTNYPACDQCAPDAFGVFPACFLPSADYYRGNIYFPVPPTNLIRCYNWQHPWVEITCTGIPGSPTCGEVSGCGQDAQYPENEQTFTCYNANGSLQEPCRADAAQSGVVVESLSGLMWQRIPSAGKSWYQAQEHCADLTHAGYDDWRLPGPLELRAIFDISKWEAYNSTVFPELMDMLWASLAWVNDNDWAWAAEMFSGGTWYLTKGSTANVLCVRDGGPAEADSRDNTWGNRFVVTEHGSDPEVFDAVTGLTWQSLFTPDRNWAQALSHCESSGYAGQSDWRLPNQMELASLVNFQRHDPACDFPDMPSEFVWSSTSIFAGSPDMYTTPESARGVDFEKGYDRFYPKNTGRIVLCVRGGLE